MHMICVCSLKIVDVYMKKAAGPIWIIMSVSAKPASATIRQDI